MLRRFVLATATPGAMADGNAQVPPCRFASIAKPPRCIYKHRVVARTREDLHDYVLFADRPCASEPGCLLRLLTALSDGIDRAGCPIPKSR
jgi:hypothetical protein